MPWILQFISLIRFVLIIVVIVVVLAEVKEFSIASNLAAIREILEREQKPRQDSEP